MSRPEPINDSSLDLEESLALVRKILAEGVPAAEPVAPRPAPTASAPIGARAPAPAPRPQTSAPRDTIASEKTATPKQSNDKSAISPAAAHVAGVSAHVAGVSLSEALRSVASASTATEKRLGLVAGVDEDLADLVDLGPLASPVPDPAARATTQPEARLDAAAAKPVQPAPAPRPAAPVAEARELSPLDLKARARVAPSLEPELRSTRQAASLPPVTESSERKWPSLDLPQPGGLPSPLAADTGRGPGARLPRLGGVDGPGVRAPEPVLPPPGEASRGWPLGAMRSSASEDKTLSAPPSEPVVIAAMPRLEPRPAPGPAAGSTLDNAAAFMEGVPSQPRIRPLEQALTLPMPVIDERASDHRFEVIASMAMPPVQRPMAPPAPAAASPVATPEPALRELEPQAPAACPAPDEPAAASIEHEQAPPAADERSGPSVIAAMSMPPETATLPSEPEAGPVSDVASALDKLVADLAASTTVAADSIAVAAPQHADPAADVAEASVVAEAAPPATVGEPEAAAAPVASAEPAASSPTAAEAEASPRHFEPVPASDIGNAEEARVEAPASVISSADAFIGGVHAPGEEPRAPVAPGADAMLKLVGTSVSLERHGFDIPAEHALDDSVAELLRPMIREWLDANLPRILEKAVRKEMAGRPKPPAPGPSDAT